MALRLAGLGVAAAVALHVALNKRKHEDKEKERRRRAHRSEASSGADRRAGRTDADSAREPRQQVLEVSCTSGPKEPARPPSTAKPPAKRSWPVRVATLLLRLLLSIAMALGLQVAASGGAPVQWTTVVLSSTVLFVINELGQRALQSAKPKPQQQASVPVPVPVQVKLYDFTGLWIKDRAASDSMDEACSLMRLNPLMRTAIRLVKGLQIRQGKGEFEWSLLSGLLWFKVTERYPLSGEERSWKRRDMRRGKHVASVQPQSDGSLKLSYTWSDPLGGSGTDTFSCPTPDTLHMDTLLTVGGKTITYRQVYRKQG